MSPYEKALDLISTKRRGFLTALCGASGVGKTTIINKLKENPLCDSSKQPYDICFITEVVRDVYSRPKYKDNFPNLSLIRKDTDACTRFQYDILIEQIKREQHALSKHKIVISDRSILDNFMYTLFWCNREHPLFDSCVNIVHDLIYAKHNEEDYGSAYYNILIHVPPFGKKVDDGFRTYDLSYQKEQDKLLVMLLPATYTYSLIPYTTIEDRVEEVKMLLQSCIGL